MEPKTEGSSWEHLHTILTAPKSLVPPETKWIKAEGGPGGPQPLEKAQAQRTFPLPGRPGRILPQTAFSAKTERKGARASLADPIRTDGRERDKGTCWHCVGANPPVQ